MTDEEISEILYQHCGRIEDDDLRANTRSAVRAAVDRVEIEQRAAVAAATRAVSVDFKASGDEDLDALVQQAMRDLCRLLKVDFVA